MPEVAVSRDFLDAFARLPKSQQRKTSLFLQKFRKDPTQSGINFERLAEARDPKVRSVRIDQAYRAIVIHPPRGDVYLVVWVDNHDEAYRWVKNRTFEVNPLSGAIQIYDVPQVAGLAGVIDPSEPGAGGATRHDIPRAAAQAQAFERPNTPSVTDGTKFLNADDEALLLAGVPAPLLPSVNALQSDEDLDRLAPHLPEEASEMLYLLAAGYEVADAFEEAERSRAKSDTVDVEDFEAALAREASQRRFAIPGDEAELDDMLDAPLEQWRIFLHPSQRRLVRMKANGPIRVLGGAGTGKTVVLMHRARHLARDIFTGDDDRILVTTFTRNLAGDLAANLQRLCGPEYERLEIVNLHRWAYNFMGQHGFEPRVASVTDSHWEEACSEEETLGLPVGFFKDEWKQVVQEQDVVSRDAYLAARRVGRGVRLDRRKRATVWKVMERYRENLKSQKLVEWSDLIREARLYIQKQNFRLPYRAILADEAQDFTGNDLRLLRAMVPEGPADLFLAGDGHQRIYGGRTRLSDCGIQVRGRSRRLKINYRTTQQIRARAVAVLRGCEIDDLDQGQDSLKGFHSLRQGPVPELAHFKKETEEAEFIVTKLKYWLDECEVPPSSICIAVRGKTLLNDRYKALLKSRSIPWDVIKTDPKPIEQVKGVRLATMHRMKGLEFPKVILAGIGADIFPRPGDVPADIDPVAAENWELNERCLLYVAMTRARDELVITGYGEPSALL